MDLRIRFSWEL